jgi:hypothetical protein
MCDSLYLSSLRQNGFPKFINIKQIKISITAVCISLRNTLENRVDAFDFIPRRMPFAV